MSRIPGSTHTFRVLALLAYAAWLSMAAGVAGAQPAPSQPPAAGVVEVSGRPVNESFEFMGRVEAVDRVDVVARVVAFIDEQLFREGAEVNKGDLLYRLERAPFEASLAASQATIAQAEAQLTNARADLARARQLRERGSGTEVAEENALAAERTAAAQLQAAQAQARLAEINLGYTEIRAPISGRIGRSAISVGNVVGPSSGTLATIVSQDPMYVTFPVSRLAAWLQRARSSLLASFARGVLNDEAAVRAAIASLWSNGQTEGQITRLKLVKRQMYGRGKIDLLQARLIGAT